MRNDKEKKMIELKYTKDKDNDLYEFYGIRPQNISMYETYCIGSYFGHRKGINIYFDNGQSYKIVDYENLEILRENLIKETSRNAEISEMDIMRLSELLTDLRFTYNNGSANLNYRIEKLLEHCVSMELIKKIESESISDEPGMADENQND